ncbi:MAG: glycosyltransferase [Tannerella sp.]|nr:glycosyltransferase [Tannerella sp.]
MNNHPLFSIITVTFNAGKVLERTILSVVNQTCPYIEYIIVDGNSSDNTKDIIKQYDLAISHWISEPDAGLYDAMNKGLGMAKGDYVWFLNAGDTLPHNNTVKDLAAVAEQSGWPDILYGETDLTDRKGKILAARRLKAPKVLTWKSFRMGMLVCHQAFIAKRNIAPTYDLQYRFSADFDWCIRCMKTANTIANSHLRVVNYLYEGLTTANLKASLKERYAIMCKYYGTFVTSLLHVWFAVRFYWAKWTQKIM